MNLLWARRRGHGLQSGVAGGLRDRAIWRTSACGALWPWILMGRRELDWADRFFSRWGEAAVLMGRLLPVIRTFIALPAGLARMPRGKFHIYTFLGSWPWCFALAYFGMKLGENWRSLGKYFHQFDRDRIALVAAWAGLSGPTGGAACGGA